MNCDAIIEDLQAFLDNELQTTRRSEVELHLKGCKDCSQMISDLGDLSSLLRSCDVPTPNLPTGQQILVQTGFKTLESNPFSNFIHSVYTFLFKYKAPVLATVSAVAIVAVVINIEGFKQGKLFYSESPATSPAVVAQEKALNEDLATSSTSIQSAPQEQDLAKSKNDIVSKEVTSADQSQPKTLGASEPFQANNLDANVATGAEGGVSSDLVRELAQNKRDFAPSNTANLPSPPAALAPEKKPAKVESDNKEQYRDELEKTEAGRSIIIDKDTTAKKEAAKPIESTKQPSPVAVAAEEVADKARDNRVIAPKDSSTNERAKGKLAETSGEKAENKLIDSASPASGASAGNIAIRTDPKEKAPARPDSPSVSMAKPGLAAGQSMATLPSSRPGSAVMGKRAEESSNIGELEARKTTIKSAQMAIETKELNPAKERLNQVIKEQQGSLVVTESEQTIKVTIKVPVAKFEATLAQLRKLGKVTQEKTSDISLDDLEKQTVDSKKADSKNENSKKSDDKEHKEPREIKRRQIEANTAVINLVLQVKGNK